MQLKTLKNNTEASEKHMSSQYKTSYRTIESHSPKSYPEVHAVSDIVSGRCESLKNVQKYRLLMHQEIKDILKKHMFTIDRKALPDRWTLTREEE